MTGTITKHPDRIEIASPEAYLRHPHLHESQEIDDLLEREKDYLSVHVGWWLERALKADTESGMPLIIDAMNRDEHMRYRMVETSSDKIFGSLDAFSHDRDEHTAVISYWMAEDFQGRGLATIALKTFSGYLFEAWDLRSITAKIKERNIPSQECITRLGAQPAIRPYYDTTQRAYFRDWKISRAG